MNLSPENPVLIQGITDPLGKLHAARMKEYGTQVIAGVSSGFGGSEIEGIPVFDLVEQALAATGPIDTSLLFLPPYQILDAALEALAAGIRQLILVTGNVPPLDMVRLLQRVDRSEARLLGPGSHGAIVPDRLLLGTHPADAYVPGKVGILSRYSAVSTELALALNQTGLGQSICVHLGSANLVGSDWLTWLKILEEDEKTEAIVLIGGVGGDREEQAAEFLRGKTKKPTIAYLAGLSIPPDKQWGQSSAFSSPPNSMLRSAPRRLPTKVVAGSLASKLIAFEDASIPVAESLLQIPALLDRALKPDVKLKKPRRR